MDREKCREKEGNKKDEKKFGRQEKEERKDGREEREGMGLRWGYGHERERVSGVVGKVRKREEKYKHERERVGGWSGKVGREKREKTEKKRKSIIIN